MAYAGLTLENPASGERITFRQTAADTDGELVAIDLELPAGRRVPGPLHIHPRQEERFEVVEGTMRFRMGRERIVAGPGEVVVVPAGVPHDFANAGDTAALVRVEVRPALEMERLFETAVRLAEQGRTLRGGLPRPLDLALFVREFEDEVQAAFPPRWVQRLALAPLAWFARRRRRTGDLRALAGGAAAQPSRWSPGASDLCLIGAERAGREHRAGERERRQQAAVAGHRGPVDAALERLAAGLDGPVDGVIVGDRRDPVGNQLALHERRREERQRQLQERDRSDQGLLLARDESERVGERRERGAEQDGGEHERCDAERPPSNATPIASAMPTITSDWISACTVFWPRRPTISDQRLAGVTSSRSVTPRSRSSIMDIPFQPLEKNAVMTSTPGTRYCL